MHSIRVFTEFPVDPYYEPLAWFMIVTGVAISLAVCIINIVLMFTIFKSTPSY